ncbi:UNVERIFIED_CONTAM: hypothetical protein Sradi_5835000 [Sesamum radiatum]|uniref:Uncharacterized protein n=1 Tax=Sesamum radiatum TaxID=300843 RepID=A0AAW2KPR1_SESRA
MLRISQVYVVPNRHIRYAATKALFGTKMIEVSTVQEHGVKMLSLVEKLKDLKVDLGKETLFLPHLTRLFMNYNMNELDKDLHELINMLVQYEVTIEKSVRSIFVGEALTLEAKGKGAGRWIRKKGKTESATARAQSTRVAQLGMGKGKRKAVR